MEEFNELIQEKSFENVIYVLGFMFTTTGRKIMSDQLITRSITHNPCHEMAAMSWKLFHVIIVICNCFKTLAFEIKNGRSKFISDVDYPYM